MSKNKRDDDDDESTSDDSHFRRMFGGMAPCSWIHKCLGVKPLVGCHCLRGC